MKRLVNLKLISDWALLSIIAVLWGSMLVTSSLAATSVAQPAPASGAKPAAPATPAGVTPDKPAAAVAPGSLLQLKLMPQKEIFTNREGLVMQFIFTAKAKTKLCLDKDILSQMQVSLYKSGVGKLPLKPLVIKDNSHLFLEPMRVVWLNAGQSLTVRANLKRFEFDGGSNWMPGEYSADATFNLCEQTPVEPVTDPGQEAPVKAARPGWFMIME